MLKYSQMVPSPIIDSIELDLGSTKWCEADHNQIT